MTLLPTAAPNSGREECDAVLKNSDNSLIVILYITNVLRGRQAGLVGKSLLKNSDSLSSIPRWKEGNAFHKLHSHLHMCAVACVCPLTHTHDNSKIKHPHAETHLELLGLAFSCVDDLFCTICWDLNGDVVTKVNERAQRTASLACGDGLAALAEVGVGSSGCFYWILKQNSVGRLACCLPSQLPWLSNRLQNNGPN